MPDNAKLRQLAMEGKSLAEESMSRFDSILDVLGGCDEPAPKPTAEHKPTFLLDGSNVSEFPGPKNFPQKKHPHTCTLADIGGRSNAIRLEIKDGDSQWKGDRTAKKPKRRAEFAFRPWQFGYGEEAWAGGMFYLPSDPMKSVRGLTFIQLHNNPEKGEMMQIVCNGGSLYAAGKNEEGHFHIGSGLPISPYLDRWTRVLINFRGEVGRKSFVKVWIDGKLLGEAHNVKLSGKMGPYFKCGLYYWGYDVKCKQKHAVAYFDQIAIGSTKQSVMPA